MEQYGLLWERHQIQSLLQLMELIGLLFLQVVLLLVLELEWRGMENYGL